MFKNFFLRQNYLKILLEKASKASIFELFHVFLGHLVEKQEDKWAATLEEMESLRLELQILNKTKNDYCVSGPLSLNLNFCQGNLP